MGLEQPWDGVAVMGIVGRATVQLEARFLKVYAGDVRCSYPKLREIERNE